MKVKIHNFQSIKEIELEIEGFTAIVGRSNIGKSAIVRAIEGALSNKEGEDFVRKGTKCSEVEIDCPEISLYWKKGSGYNDYIIDGETLESVGRGSPPHIAEAGFREIETNRAKLNVQVASQFSPIFLLDPSKTSGAVAAEIISDIGRLSEVQTALRQCGKDRRSLESVVRVRENDLIRTREDLELYDELDDDMNQVNEIKTQYADIGVFREQIGVMSELKEEKDAVELVLEGFEGFESIDIPKWASDPLNEELKALETFSSEASDLQNVVAKYDGLDEIEVPTFDGDLRQVKVFTQFKGHVENARNAVEAFDGLEDIELPDLAEVGDLIDECHEFEQMRARHESLSAAIPSLAKEVGDLDEAASKAHEELHSIFVEAGECPMCGVEVDE